MLINCYCCYFYLSVRDETETVPDFPEIETRLRPFKSMSRDQDFIIIIIITDLLWRRSTGAQQRQFTPTLSISSFFLIKLSTSWSRLIVGSIKFVGTQTLHQWDSGGMPNKARDDDDDGDAMWSDAMAINGRLYDHDDDDEVF